jgi:NAD(P)-dependent dehydrogenase (short-subunit alcohol dehydrogenase family)
MRLAGEIAIVTGAGRGIGAEVARVLAGEGAAVAVTARRLADAEAVADRIVKAGGKARALVCDVADARSIRDAFAEAGRELGAPTILVNNAGAIAPIGKFAGVEPRDWASIIAVNLVGAAAVAHAALQGMLGAGRGTIVNLSSGAAHRAMEGWSAYCASKAALAMVTKSLALEYGGAGIRVFGLAPGLIDTEMQAAIRASGIGPVAKLARGALANPRDPANAIAFLCSPAGTAFAGREIDVRNADFRVACGLAPLPA